MIFLVLFIFALFSSILEGKQLVTIESIRLKKRKVYVGAKLLFFVMLRLCALRSVEVGVDTSHYYIMFSSGTSRFVEFGYWLIRHISSMFGNSFQMFLALYAIVSLYPLYKMLGRESVNVSFSLLIYLSFSNYFYPEVFNVIRATAAIAFFCIALSYWVANRNKFALLLFVMSCLFHITAGVAIVIFICSQFIKWLPRQITYIIIIASFIFGVIFQTGFSAYAESLSYWMEDFSGDITGYYSHHLNDFLETNFNIVGTLSNTLPFTLFAILLYDERNSTNIFYKLFIIGVVLSNVFISVTLVYRITMFLSVFLIVVLPNTYRRISNPHKLILRCLILFMLMWYVYKLLGSTSDTMAGIIPYSFFFE